MRNWARTAPLVASFLLGVLVLRLVDGPGADEQITQELAARGLEEKRSRVQAEQKLAQCETSLRDARTAGRNRAEQQEADAESRPQTKARKKQGVGRSGGRSTDAGDTHYEQGNDVEASSSRLPFLAVAIPTVPRPDDQRYLESVLASFGKQVHGVWEGNIAVHVMNMRKGYHPVFDEMRLRYKGQLWVTFHEVHPRDSFVNDASATMPPVHPIKLRQERPDEKVSRQSLDVALLLKKVAGTSQHLLLSEDDFDLCPNGLTALQYMITKATLYHSNWAAIRCAFGLAGIVLHNTAPFNDVAAFSSYLQKHYKRRPPDHLVVEWYAGEIQEARAYFGGRPVMAFRYNILHHIGFHSTLRAAKPWSLPGCFEQLVEPQVFAVEAWNPSDCPHDDLWPCTSQHASPALINWTNPHVHG
ncbi:hypothetical protein DIPPA_23473 [Diplonema papillatum]|nr:hypothetical protein DIPPA_23473 [Diplonema papillatum]